MYGPVVRKNNFISTESKLKFSLKNISIFGLIFSMTKKFFDIKTKRLGKILKNQSFDGLL